MCYVFYRLFSRQQTGKTMTIPELRKESTLLPHYQMYDLLEHLQRVNWVNQSSNGQWLLSKDMTETSLFDLHKILPVRLPLFEGEMGNDQLSKKLKAKLGNHPEQIEQQLTISIADFFKSEKI